MKTRAKTSKVAPGRTVTFSNNLMKVMIELTDDGLAIENIREIIEADVINLNGLLMMYPSPMFYQYLGQRYAMNETMLHYVEQKLHELGIDTDEKVTLN